MCCPLSLKQWLTHPAITKWCSKKSYKEKIYFWMNIQKAQVLIWNLSRTQISQITRFCSLLCTCICWKQEIRCENMLNITSLSGIGTPKQVCYCPSWRLWRDKKAILREKVLLPVIHSGSGLLLESSYNNQLYPWLKYSLFDLFLNKENWLFFLHSIFLFITGALKSFHKHFDWQKLT